MPPHWGAFLLMPALSRGLAGNRLVFPAIRDCTRQAELMASLDRLKVPYKPTNLHNLNDGHMYIVRIIVNTPTRPVAVLTVYIERSARLVQFVRETRLCPLRYSCAELLRK